MDALAHDPFAPPSIGAIERLLRKQRRADRISHLRSIHLDSAFVEAAGLIGTGEAGNVLLTCFEAPLPEAQQPFEANPPTAMAASFLVSKHAPGAGLTLERHPEPNEAHATPFWRQMRDLLAFLESGDADLEIPCHGCTWHWRRTNDAA